MIGAAEGSLQKKENSVLSEEERKQRNRQYKRKSRAKYRYKDSHEQTSIDPNEVTQRQGNRVEQLLKKASTEALTTLECNILDIALGRNKALLQESGEHNAERLKKERERARVKWGLDPEEPRRKYLTAGNKSWSWKDDSWNDKRKARLIKKDKKIRDVLNKNNHVSRSPTPKA